MIAIQEGVVIAGKYRLERSLARGGMGAVWIGRHLELGTSVAVKFIDAVHAASDSARSRFKREAKAAALLNTPHVVKVYDYGVEDGTPYIVMELLEGEDLGTRLKREGRLSLAAASAILTPVCKALHNAHKLGLVHRDLKPANIFIARQDDDEVVKVLDFGIAKWADPSDSGPSTHPGTMLGSPLYMSPEQARSLKELDHRSDLWSLGVIMFRAVTGRSPFERASLPAVIMAICAEPIPLPSQFVPDLGPEVDRFFARSLAREPAQRFQSSRELALALSALSGREVSGSSSLSGATAGTELRSSMWSLSGLRDSSPSRGGADTSPSSETLSEPRRAPMLWATLGAALVGLVALGAFLLRGAGAASSLPPSPSAESTQHVPAPSAPPPMPNRSDPYVALSATASSTASGAPSAAPPPLRSSALKPKPKPVPSSPRGAPSAGPSAPPAPGGRGVF